MLFNPLSNLGGSGGNVQIFEGQYTGNGMAGNVLKFPFQPKLVYVIHQDSVSSGNWSSSFLLRPIIYGEAMYMMASSNSSGLSLEKGRLEWTENNVQLKYGGNAFYNFNQLNQKYRYYGITW